MNIIEMAMAAKMAGGGTGPIDPKRLPEGYPYKEGSKTVIEWDGNSEGRPSFGSETSGACKVSDEVFDNLAGCPITFTSGDEVLEMTLSEGVEAMNNIYVYGDGVNQTSVLVVLGENAQNLETGTYFYRGYFYGNIEYVSKLTVSTETIHTMAPEFLPAGVGGGGMIVKLVIPEDGEPVLDKTYEEIKAALLAGNRVEIHQSISVIPGVVSVYHAAGISQDDSRTICFYCVEPIHSHSPSDAIDISVLRVRDDNTFDMLRPRINVSWR